MSDGNSEATAVVLFSAGVAYAFLMLTLVIFTFEPTAKTVAVGMFSLLVAATNAVICIKVAWRK